MPPQPLTLAVCRRPAACVPMRRSCMAVVSISTHAHVRAGGFLSLCLISNDVAGTHHEDSESLGVLVPCVVVLTWARCPPPRTPAPRASRLLRVHTLTYKDESCRSHPTCALRWCGTSPPRRQTWRALGVGRTHPLHVAREIAGGWPAAVHACRPWPGLVALVQALTTTGQVVQGYRGRWGRQR